MFKCSNSNKENVEAKEGRKQKHEKEMPTELFTYELWWKLMRRRHIAHIRTNIWFSRFNIALGVTIIILSAVAGSSVFVGVTEDNNVYWFYAAVVISIILSALTALKTFLKFGERAELHNVYQAKYGDLRHDIEKILQDYVNCVLKYKVQKGKNKEDMEVINASKNSTNKEDVIEEEIEMMYIYKECKDEKERKLVLSQLMDDINERMKEIDESRPTIPQLIYNYARREVRKLMEKEFTYSQQLLKIREDKKI